VSPTFQSLRGRPFRLFWLGMTVSNVGTWMQRVAQDWLVLQLSGGSGTAVGLAVGLQFLPFLLVSPVGGVLADRFSKRRLLMVTNAVAAALALSLAVLTATGAVRVWHVLVLAFLLGCSAAVDTPGRQAFVSELVPPGDVANAVGLNSAAFHAARVVGPASAGLLIAGFGTPTVFAVNALSFLAPLIALHAIRSPALRTPAPPLPGQGGLRTAVAVVRERPAVATTLALVFVAGTFGLNFQLTTALMATQVFGVGAGQFGLLTSVMAVGAVAGALLTARSSRPSLRRVLVAGTLFGVAEIVAGLMPTFWTFAASLIPVGLAALTLLTTAQALIQLSVPAVTRGRVMALYSVLFIGGTPLGAPTIGWIADTAGARWTVSGGGAIVLAGAALAAAWALRRGALRTTSEPVPGGRLRRWPIPGRASTTPPT
jgi:MFS family permease